MNTNQGIALSYVKVTFLSMIWLTYYIAQAQILSFFSGIFIEIYGPLENAKCGSKKSLVELEIATNLDDSVAIPTTEKGIVLFF